MKAKDHSLNILFFGSPEFAIPSIKALLERGHNITAVVTQPDAPAGRGKKLKAPPAALYAKEHGLRVLQPISLSKKGGSKENSTYFPDELKQLPRPDFAIVVAYGKLIPEALLGLPKQTFLNIHPSSLPRWRGAAPLQRTILAGDSSTEVCIMKLVKELDAGPVYIRKTFEVPSTESFGSLHDRLAVEGANLLIKAIDQITAEDLSPIPQKTEGLCYADKFEVTDSKLNWIESAVRCHNRIRASNPKPGARTVLDGNTLKILEAEPQTSTATGSEPNSSPGQLILLSDKSLGICCGDGEILKLHKIQLTGKNPVAVADFLNGSSVRNRLRAGELIFCSS